MGTNISVVIYILLPTLSYNSLTWCCRQRIEKYNGSPIGPLPGIIGRIVFGSVDCTYFFHMIGPAEHLLIQANISLNAELPTEQNTSLYSHISVRSDLSK